MGIRTRLKQNAQRFISNRAWQQQGAPTPRDFEEQIYAAAVQAGDVCFDVGANEGSVSLFLAQLIGPQGTVYAFEPVLPTFAKLCANTQAHGAVKAPIITLPFGMSDTERDADIFIPNGAFQSASMADAAQWQRAQRSQTMQPYRCRFLTLDGFAAQAKMQPDFIKIDVEGAERFVLRGGLALLGSQSPPMLLIELFAPWQKAFGFGLWQVLALLKEYRYEFLFACPTGLVAHTPTQAQPAPPAYVNGYNVLAFLPSQHHTRLQKINTLRQGGAQPILSMTPPPMPNVE